jgi:hypothetical protein
MQRCVPLPLLPEDTLWSQLAVDIQIEDVYLYNTCAKRHNDLVEMIENRELGKK